LALGCMGMSDFYGPADEAESLATIAEAIDRGVTLLDTGDFYGMGENEMLLRRALVGRRERVSLSVKFGALRGPDGTWHGTDARPEAVANFVTYSLRRLGTDVIDVYRPARLDPKVPIEDTVGAIKDLVDKGYVRHIGLSEVSADTVRRASAVHPIVDVQIEYSLASRAPESKLFPTLKELGISATLYGVLSRGLLSGSKPTGPTDYRAHLPRFNADNQQANAAAIERLQQFARDTGRTPAQLCVAWVLARQPEFVALVGSRTRNQLREAFGALDKPLSDGEVKEVESVLTRGSIAGDRYPTPMMSHLDSER